MGELCSPIPNAMLEIGFCSYELPITIQKPRSVVSLGVSDSVVLEKDFESVVLLYDSDGDTVADSKRTLVSASSLNHGLAIHNGYIYASSDTTVYRWSYLGTDFATIGAEEIVVENMNADGQGGAPQGHQTRTLAFDSNDRLYISIGSNANVDPDSYRSRIRRFDIYDESVVLPLDFQTGEVFADGLRNEVGLAFDSFGVLWGVENGADNLVRSDLGGDIHQDNPAEELNRFLEADAGKHWGYPFCWTEYNLPEGIGLGRGTVWAWPDFLSTGQVTDELCRADYVPPILAMQGHSAPLGIVFYEYTETRPEGCGEILPFPEAYDGFAFVAFHGSWNRDIPTGYKVVYIPFDKEGNVSGSPVDFLAHEPPDAQWEDGFRPVDVDFDDCGRLLVTSDGTYSLGSKVVIIQYIGNWSNEPDTTTAPSNSSSSINDTSTIFPTLAPSIGCPCPSPPNTAGIDASEDLESSCNDIRPVLLATTIVPLGFILFLLG